MRRRFFRLSALICLLLGAATAALWVRSYWIGERLDWSVGKGQRRLYIEQGRVTFLSAPLVGMNGKHYEGWNSAPVGTRWYVDDGTTWGIDQRSATWAGFKSTNGTYASILDEAGVGSSLSQRPRYWVLVVPCWFFVVICLPLPVCFVLVELRRFRRRAIGRCPVCGYDLRASSIRCPECGTAISVGSPAAA